jgi:hypothetical protein
VRRAIAAGAAAALVLEALAVGFVNWVLGLAVRHQKMSLGGLDPGAMAAGSWAGGGVFALFLIACAVIAARVALHDRSPNRVSRIVLIVCAVVHGVLGAIVVGLVGWYAFVVLMLVLALLVGTLLLHAPEDRSPAPAPAAPPVPPGAPATSTAP